MSSAAAAHDDDDDVTCLDDCHSTNSSDDVGSESECSQVSKENRNVKRIMKLERYCQSIALNGVMTCRNGATNHQSLHCVHCVINLYHLTMLQNCLLKCFTFSWGRTKTKAMVCNIIADKLKNSTVFALKSGPLSLLTHTTNQRQCCLLVRYFDNTTGFVKSRFYKVLHLSRANSE